ncbi:MAG: type III polyketide synthase, partial [Candidatus Eremiobacteraeota bacterium]|nr:type III polyketide synthase [Candidatus Eremiobacteraeota bacterium]
PPHYYSQEELIDALKEFWAGRVFNLERLEQFHRNVLVEGRHLALAREQYRELKGFGDRNTAWIEVATELSTQVVGRLLEGSGCSPEQLALFAFTTVTGLAVPSIEARLMNRLPLPRSLRRMPLFGLGCLAGAAGVARAADSLAAYPDKAAIMLAVELCSLTLQAEDFSIANLVASGLFGDGAAAVLLVGDEHPLAGQGPRVLATASDFYPDSERVMGWDITDNGFKIVLANNVPDYAHNQVADGVRAFLADHDLGIEDIGWWITHPGGPKVMSSLCEGLGLPDEALELSRQSLARVGNMSSASVLFILDEVMSQARPGDYGLLMAMGPAFCSELVLLRWQ